MHSYFISYSSPSGTHLPFWDSTVITSNKPLLTGQQLRDWEVLQGLTDNREARIHSITRLPSSGEHPSGKRPYSYFLSYVITDGLSIMTFGNTLTNRDEPIHTLDDLRRIELDLRDGLTSAYVRLIGIQPLQSATPGLDEEFDGTLYGDPHDGDN